MILHKSKKNVDTNMTGAGSFSIKASAKAFKILSDGLYSDKIRAVVRELSCNALDSHTAAGCPDRPIKVHLPSLFEPYFSVQDFGLGLSKESVMNLYTTYFESTKTESNDQIGALGLGSKSPFSYTDSFTVTSVYDGVKSMYSAYIGSNGEPCIQPLSDEDTTEENGVTVSFAVKKEDTGTFKNRAELVYRPFTVKPEVVGVDSFEMKSRGEVRYSGNGWTIYESSYYNRDQYVTQGNIEYPLDSDNVDCENDKQRFILGQNCDIEFKLGELDIAASRESIGYDETTKANIRARLEEVFNELTDVVNKDIEDSKTFWEACRKAKKLQENFYHSNMMTDGLSYKGQTIKHSFKLDQGEEVVGYFHNHRTQTKVGRNVFKSVITTDNNFTFVVNDMKGNKGISRVRAFVSENVNSYCIVLSDTSKLNKFGNPEFKLASDFPDNSIATVKTSTVGKHFKDYYHSTSTCWQWDNVYERIVDTESYGDDVIYYLPIKSKECIYGDVYGLVEAAKYMGIVESTRKITGIKESFIGTKKYNELAEEVTLVNLKDYMTEIIENMKDNQIFKNMVEGVLSHTIKKRETDVKVKEIIKNLKKDINMLLPGGVAKDIIDNSVETINYIEVTKMCEYTARFFNTTLNIDVEVNSLEEELFSTYPLLKMLDRWQIGADEDKVILNYVNMVDSQS